MFFRLVKCIAFSTGYFLLIHSVVLANQIFDPSYPEIGKPCPAFILTGIQNYRVKDKSIKEFRGKPFILDFFTFGCSSCFESFPKINLTKKLFGDLLDIILVGKEEKGIESQFEKFKARDQLNLPVCYSKFLFERLGIVQVPFVLWVDRRGIVKAITNCQDVNPSNIDRFLKNESFDFIDRSHRAELIKDWGYDWRKPLLINDNGGNDTSYYARSILSGWNPGIPQQIPGFVSNTAYNEYGCMTKNRFQATGIWVSLLYKMAYGDTLWQIPSLDLPDSYGQYYTQPELLIHDSSAFKTNFQTGSGLYCYSLSVPPWRSTTLDMQKMMQHDLENYFGFKVCVEKKFMPCWILTADPMAKEKLKTGGGSRRIPDEDRTDMTFANIPVKALIIFLFMSNQKGLPFIDETGIAYNIDLHLKIFWNDPLEKVIAELASHGLILKKSTRSMKVIVVRDP